MATTLTSRGKFQLGNGIVADYGDFNSTDTSTTTLSVSGGYIIAALFFDAQNNLCGDAGTTNTVTLSAKALSGFVTSWTVTPSGAITGGSYLIIHGGE